VPEWKWEEIAMNFIVGLPRTQSGYDFIWVIVDQLTNVAHFIPVKTTYFGTQLAELYMSRIACLHGVSKKIMSDRGTQFTLKFWERLHETLDTQLCFSSTYHPQIDGQTIIPRSEIAGMKPPYVCPGCFIHTYSNNMINRLHVQ
jgi:hypothetical protein